MRNNISRHLHAGVVELENNNRHLLKDKTGLNQELPWQKQHSTRRLFSPANWT
jgi:hypothetical protein